jgi:hypothetical protein
MEKEILQIDCSNGRDMYATFKCICPSELFPDKPELGIKHTIRLTGYNDDYFWDVVNKEPRELICKCGKKYKYQWINGVVELERL